MPQSSVLIALPGIPRDDPDWHAALVLAHILGGGQQSRLFSEVREKRGLAYSVSAAPAQPAARQRCWWSRPAAPTSGWPSRCASSGPSWRASREGVTEQELAEAKTYLSGSLALLLDSSGCDCQPAAHPAGRPPAARLSRPAGGADRRGQGGGRAPRRAPPAARGGDDHGRRRQARGRHGLMSLERRLARWTKIRRG